jgi:hypothetical protein
MCGKSTRALLAHQIFLHITFSLFHMRHQVNVKVNFEEIEHFVGKIPKNKPKETFVTRLQLHHFCRLKSIQTRQPYFKDRLIIRRFFPSICNQFICFPPKSDPSESQLQVKQSLYLQRRAALLWKKTSSIFSWWFWAFFLRITRKKTPTCRIIILLNVGTRNAAQNQSKPMDCQDLKID